MSGLGALPRRRSWMALLTLVVLVPALPAQDGNVAAAPLAAIEDESPERLFDNLSLLIALEASRGPHDLGVNANFGGNLSANFGFPIVRDWHLGGQVGSGINLQHAGVKVLRVLEGTRDRQQWFSTAAMFQRLGRFHWAVGYDHLVEAYYNSLRFGQVRADVGWWLTDCDQVGVWGAGSVLGERGNLLDASFRMDPISQASLYWWHEWQTGAETRLSIGVADQHGTSIVIIPDSRLTDPPIVFGLSVFVPLNDHWALFGEGNFITPSDTGTLDAYLGFAYYPGGKAKQVRRHQYAPVLPVANNPTFAIDLRQ